jgi:hypothetical protein
MFFSNHPTYTKFDATQFDSSLVTSSHSVSRSDSQSASGGWHFKHIYTKTAFENSVMTRSSFLGRIYIYTYNIIIIIIIIMIIIIMIIITIIIIINNNNNDNNNNIYIYN